MTRSIASLEIGCGELQRTKSGVGNKCPRQCTVHPVLPVLCTIWLACPCHVMQIFGVRGFGSFSPRLGLPIADFRRIHLLWCPEDQSFGKRGKSISHGGRGAGGGVSCDAVRAGDTGILTPSPRPSGCSQDNVRKGLQVGDRSLNGCHQRLIFGSSCLPIAP